MDFGPDATALEVAIRAWLAAPETLRRRHAEIFARRQRSFLHYGGSSPAGSGLVLYASPADLALLEAEFDMWFAAHHRGRGCRIDVFRVGEQTVFVIRHGQRKVRQPSLRDDGVATVEFYRPQKYDVLVYNPTDDDIAIHAGTKGEIALYLEALGRGLFKNPAYFASEDIFTLAPLVDDGPASMNCADVEGLDSMRLCEVRRIWGGVQQERETRQADDLFAAMASRDADLKGGRMTYAMVKFTVTGSTKERSATIRPRGTTFERGEDSVLLGTWMRKRGFIRKRRDAAARPVLEVA